MVHVRWTGGMAFESRGPSGQGIVFDAYPEAGGNNKGPTPMEAFVSAAAACSAMDVISILEKKRQVVTDYHVEVEWQRAPEGKFPRPITSLILRHVLKGENLDPRAVSQAVELSDQRYCSVVASLRFGPAVSSEFRID